MKRKVYVKQLKKLKATQVEANNSSKDGTTSKEIADGETKSVGKVRKDVPNLESKTAVPNVAALPNVNVLIKGSLHHSKAEEQIPTVSEKVRVLSEPQPETGKVRVLPEPQPKATASVASAPKLDNSVFASQDTYCYQASQMLDSIGGSDTPSYAPLTDVLMAGPESASRDLSMQYASVPHAVPDRRPYSYSSNYVGMTYTPLHPVEQTVHSEADIPKQPSDPVATGQDGEYGYLQHAPTWEQENGRFVNYPWKYPDIYQHPTNTLALQNAKGTNHSDVSLVGHNHVQDTPVFQRRESPRKGRMNSSDGPPKLSGGRRRRKRLQTPVQRSAANMRERRRMCHLNVAFDLLKEHLPNVKDKKKLSRIQTLKAAIYYIHLLRDSLNLS